VEPEVVGDVTVRSHPSKRSFHRSRTSHTVSRLARWLLLAVPR
jgi:hypothetical protein